MDYKHARSLILEMAENPDKALAEIRGGEALVAVSTVLVRNGLLAASTCKCKAGC